MDKCIGISGKLFGHKFVQVKEISTGELKLSEEFKDKYWNKYRT